jgi:hypothetical protein
VTLARRLKRLFTQPRIPGLARIPGDTRMVPKVEDTVRAYASREARSVSSVRTRAVSLVAGYNPDNGERLSPTEQKRALLGLAKALRRPIARSDNGRSS